MIAAFRTLVVLVASLLILNILTILLSVLIYTRLTDEMEIARVSFVSEGENRYTAKLKRVDSDIVEEYLILGDQWQIDASFIKMYPWANIFGFDARYFLDRLSGRYQDINDQNSKNKLSHDLAGEKIASPYDWVSDYSAIFPFIDAEYGSSTYQPINVEQVYVVYRTQFGIITRNEDKLISEKEDGLIDGVLRWWAE